MIDINVFLTIYFCKFYPPRPVLTPSGRLPTKAWWVYEVPAPGLPALTIGQAVLLSQCRIRGVAADRQAQQDSHTDIPQLYFINRVNSRNSNNNEARKLKFSMKQDKFHI